MSHGITSLLSILFPFGNLNNQNFLAFVDDKKNLSSSKYMNSGISFDDNKYNQKFPYF